jgi:hypothetical protein
MDKGQYDFKFKKPNSASKAPVIDGDTPLFSRNYIVKMLESLKTEFAPSDVEYYHDKQIDGCILVLDTVVMLAAGDMLTKDDKNTEGQ